MKIKNAMNTQSFKARFDNHTAERLSKTNATRHNNYLSLDIARHKRASPSDAQNLKINLLCLYLCMSGC